MADRQSSEYSSKPQTPRSSNQGISLANLSQPLIFGSALMPTLQPVETTPRSSGSTESSSSIGAETTGGLLALDPDEEVDSFLGQQNSPQQKTSSSSSHQGFRTPQAPVQTSTSFQAFRTPQPGQMATGALFSSTSSPQLTSASTQPTSQSNPRHFTMSASGHEMDQFLPPQKHASPLGTGSFSSSQAPPRHAAPQHPQVPAASAGLPASLAGFPLTSSTGYHTHTQPPQLPSVGYPQIPASGTTQSSLAAGHTQLTLSQPPTTGHTQSPLSQPPIAGYTQPAVISQGQSRRVYPKADLPFGVTHPSQPSNIQDPMGGAPHVPLYTPQAPTGSQIGAPPFFSPPQSTYPSTGLPPLYPQAPPMPPAQGNQQYIQPPMVHPAGVPPGGVPIFNVEPVRPHWFYMKENRVWMPFSHIDSEALEHEFSKPTTKEDRIVPTDGGRYDVNVDERVRRAVYWEEDVSVVRRCTWFFKGDGGVKLVPYKEEMAATLEAEFYSAVRQNQWPRKIVISDSEYVLLHNTNVMVHFQTCGPTDWSGEDSGWRPKVVRRGVADIEEDIEDGEPAQIDHLVFVIHGIGPIADLRFRNIIECIDDLRMVTLSMLNEHHQELAKGRTIGRIEYLPVQWHDKLHNDSNGVDERLHSISLKSISKLRDFTNSTLLDILFYTSPTYCQTIVDTVGSEMTNLLALFRKRNPSFKGQISVCGHSLGSSIMFDILYHQQDPNATKSAKQSPPAQQQNSTQMSEDSTDSAALELSEDEEESGQELPEVLSQLGLQDYTALFESEKIDLNTLSLCSESDVKEMGLPMGPRKKLMGYLRQHAALQEKHKKEKEKRAKARAESKLNSAEMVLTQSTSSLQSLGTVESVEVLYHQGYAGTGQPYVKYPKLAFKPFALFALGSPIGMFMTVRGVDQVGPDFKLPTCQKVFNIFHPFDPVAYRLEPLVDSTFVKDPIMIKHHKGRKRMHLELRDNLSRFGATLKASLIESVKNTWESINEFARAHAYSDGVVSSTQQQIDPPSTPTSIASDTEVISEDETDTLLRIGQLNSGDRIDYVLQERPLESLNEYLFALSSHVCYWLSEDTALFILRAIYKDGITT